MRQIDHAHTIRQLLEEQAVAIGGLLAVHEIDDDFVWRLFHALDAVRQKYMRQETTREDVDPEELNRDSRRSQPHPAVQEFLARVRRG